MSQQIRTNVPACYLAITHLLSFEPAPCVGKPPLDILGWLITWFITHCNNTVGFLPLQCLCGMEILRADVPHTVKKEFENNIFLTVPGPKNFKLDIRKVILLCEKLN